MKVDTVLIPNNTLIGVVVYQEETLGCLVKVTSGRCLLDILSSSLIRGGLNWLNGPYSMTQEMLDSCRPATLADFERLRLSSKGYELAENTETECFN